MAGSLAVIDSCEGCGDCCRVVTAPPFRREFDGEGEESWERLRWDRPDLMRAILEAERIRKASGDPSFGSPCLWFDAKALLCRHYDHRPRACRDFPVGGEDCRGARRRAGVASLLS